MRRILIVIRNGAFAAAIAVALAFGATQALAGNPDPAALAVPCETPPGSCNGDSYCEWWCFYMGYEDGECVIPPNCCVCFHK